MRSQTQVGILLSEINTSYHSVFIFIGKYSKLALVEEEQCEDLLLFMKLLTHLTTKDYLDFGPINDVVSPKVKSVDVVVTGISIVLPLMSEETLKVSLLWKYGGRAHFLCLPVSVRST